MVNDSISHMPNLKQKDIPIECFSGTKVEHHWYHFGCPVYVLNDKIQSKTQAISRIGSTKKWRSSIVWSKTQIPMIWLIVKSFGIRYQRCMHLGIWKVPMLLSSHQKQTHQPDLKGKSTDEPCMNSCLRYSI